MNPNYNKCLLGNHKLTTSWYEDDSLCKSCHCGKEKTKTKANTRGHKI